MAQRLEDIFSGASYPNTAHNESSFPSIVTSAVPEKALEDVKTNNARILVVDDDPNNRALLSRLLISHGYKIETADNGVGAFARLADESFDLILLDVIMPDMDGITFLTKLKADKTLRKIPVILVSACTEMYQVIKGMPSRAATGFGVALESPIPAS